MGPNNGGINHHVAVVGVCQQHLEDSLPYSRPSPASETFVGTLPVAILRRQVFPVGATTQHPQNAVHEIAIVLGSHTYRPGTPGQKTFYFAPLSGAQFVPFHVSLTSPPLRSRLTHYSLYSYTSSHTQYCFLAELSIRPSITAALKGKAWKCVSCNEISRPWPDASVATVTTIQPDQRSHGAARAACITTASPRALSGV